jgi:peptidoglycan hydrolase-like protein with peptidoglycan-binding domain
MRELWSEIEKLGANGRLGPPGPVPGKNGNENAKQDPKPESNQPSSLPATAAEPEPEYNPPAADREPTLRPGDDSPDGWVEYLQEMLNQLCAPSPNLTRNGKYDNATVKAVRAFQKQCGLQVDGIVGDQTWALMRHSKREGPGTDGLKPHTFVEKGAKARWFREHFDANYVSSADQLVLALFSVGDASIEGQKAYVFVTAPGSGRKGKTVTIPPPDGRTPDDQGDLHEIILENFKKNYPSDPPGQPLKDYVVEGYFDKELGGDHFSGGIFDDSDSGPEKKSDDGAAKNNQQPAKATETTATRGDQSPQPATQWQSLGIGPVKETMVAGEQQQFTATAESSDGSPPQDVTKLVTWTSSDMDVLDIDDKDYKGLAKAGSKAGFADITATDASGTNITARIAVKAAAAPQKQQPPKAATATPRQQPPAATQPPALREIRVSPDGLKLLCGGKKDQLYATGYYTDGSIKDLTRSARWEVEKGRDYAKVYPGGIVESLDDAGLATISATDVAGGIEALVFVTVYAPEENAPTPPQSTPSAEDADRLRRLFRQSGQTDPLPPASTLVDGVESESGR